MNPTRKNNSAQQHEIDRLLSIIEALSGTPHKDGYFTVVIPGAPSSKSITSRGDSEAEELRVTSAHLACQAEKHFEGNVAMACIFYRPNHQRIDVDNMIKHVSDAATHVLWEDDSQCTAAAGIVEYDADFPRTVVIFAEHESSLLRGDAATYPCVICKSPISSRMNAGRTKTCSTRCSTKLKGYIPLDEPIPCSHCGELFIRVSQYRKLCSPKCRQDSLRGKRRAKAKEKSKCQDCNKQLNHTRGGRCRDCWRESLKKR